MKPIYLTSGAYQSDAVIANLQRCVNLYPEINPGDTKPGAPVTHWQRPGKKYLSSPGKAGVARGLYRASNGDLYAVVADIVYFIDPQFRWFAIGVIQDGTSTASMADNGAFAGNELVLVDSTPNGYVINMQTKAFAPIVDSSGLFKGSNVVCYLQTFFCFNVPNTQNWIISNSDSVTFDALDIAAKVSYADNIQTIGVRQREIWLIGSLTSEPWSLTGAPDFPFEAISSTFIPHGTAAVYSLVSSDVSLFWVQQALTGERMIVQSVGYEAQRISTHAIEDILAKMPTVADAIGQTFQIRGHTFVVWTFPTADRTLVYDISTKQWCEFAWTDDDGNLHQDRVRYYAHAYGKILGLDWETGDLVEIDPQTFTDFGKPISFIRGWPHVIDMMNRVTHWAFTADIQCGTIQDPNAEAPILSLRYSDDRGQTWSDWFQQSLGKTGEYMLSPQFRQLGMARDRVYELMWSANAFTPLNGAYIDLEGSQS